MIPPSLLKAGVNVPPRSEITVSNPQFPGRTAARQLDEARDSDAWLQFLFVRRGDRTETHMINRGVPTSEYTEVDKKLREHLAANESHSTAPPAAESGAVSSKVESGDDEESSESSPSVASSYSR